MIASFQSWTVDIEITVQWITARRTPESFRGERKTFMGLKIQAVQLLMIVMSVVNTALIIYCNYCNVTEYH
jgi:hypothetical protein